MLSRKWKPSATAKREFAERMQNPTEAAAYAARKITRENNQRAKSKFDYRSAGGEYIPTKAQYDFCFANPQLFTTDEQSEARNQVLFGYSCREKVHHDHIHIINELIRDQTYSNIHP